MIRLTVPSIDQADLDAVSSAIESGFLVQGPKVAEFERAVATKVGTKHAIAVSNGTCALQVALAAMGVGVGDICVLPAYSWIATANVVELCGARPVFVDIDPKTFNIDVDKLSLTLKNLMSDAETGRLTRAVMPVHAFGQMADMSGIKTVCDKWDLPIVEDAACALGAYADGVAAGSSSTIGCFSFHPRKAVTTGEGGMLTTDNDRLARAARALRNHGADPESRTPDFVMAGYNFRLTEFQAALGLTQMAKLDRIVERRRAAAAFYDRMLAGTPLSVPHISSGSTHVYQSYVTLLPAGHASRRPEIISEARKQGVELQVGTIHMPLTTYYRKRYNYKEDDFPVTDSVASSALTLPLFETITTEQQQTVVDVTLALLS